MLPLPAARVVSIVWAHDKDGQPSGVTTVEFFSPLRVCFPLQPAAHSLHFLPRRALHADLYAAVAILSFPGVLTAEAVHHPGLSWIAEGLLTSNAGTLELCRPVSLPLLNSAGRSRLLPAGHPSILRGSLAVQLFPCGSCFRTSSRCTSGSHRLRLHLSGLLRSVGVITAAEKDSCSTLAGSWAHLMQPRDSVASRNCAVRHWDHYMPTSQRSQQLGTLFPSTRNSHSISTWCE